MHVGNAEKRKQLQAISFVIVDTLRIITDDCHRLHLQVEWVEIREDME